MPYIFIGFAFGFAIPYLARRFSKFMPATFACALYRIFRPNKTVSKEKRKNNHKYNLLCHRYFMRSLGWGIITAATIYLASLVLPENETPWIAFFIIMLYTLMEIDKRMLLLPDILTVPLLIVGFPTLFSPEECLDTNLPHPLPIVLWEQQRDTLFLLLPHFFNKKYPEAFGGGDIKLLSAVGSWVGLTNIPYVILLSCLLFAVSCFINKQRQGAFGPSIVIASLIILFLSEY